MTLKDIVFQIKKKKRFEKEMEGSFTQGRKNPLKIYFLVFFSMPDVIVIIYSVSDEVQKVATLQSTHWNL